MAPHASALPRVPRSATRIVEGPNLGTAMITNAPPPGSPCQSTWPGYHASGSITPLKSSHLKGPSTCHHTPIKNGCSTSHEFHQITPHTRCCHIPIWLQYDIAKVQLFWHSRDRNHRHHIMFRTKPEIHRHNCLRRTFRAVIRHRQRHVSREGARDYLFFQEDRC